MSESFDSIEHSGRRFSTGVPNWRMQDQDLTPHEFRLACWLSSHDPSFTERRLTRNAISKILGMSVNTISGSLRSLEAAGIVHIEEREIPLSDGGMRWVLVFDHEAWETDPTLDQNRSTPRIKSDSPPREHTDMSSSSRSSELECDDGAFDRFWAKYPNVKGRKRNKPKVRRQFLKALKEDRERLRSGVSWWFAHWHYPANTPYVPAPEVFFTQRWWDMDVDTVVEPQTADPNPFATFLANQPTQPKEIES